MISTALDDPKAVGANAEVFHGINFADLNTAYHQFCKNEPVDKPVVDLGQVMDFYNNAAADLPDQAQLKALKDRKLPSMSTVLDGKGAKFADVYLPSNRRIWEPLSAIPDFVQKAFIAAEDQRFYQHHGIDERGIIRAFIGNLANPGRPEGGSTITQQVVKNLLVGADVTYQRKICEMIVASRLENTLSKNEILQLYINSVYMGRGAWGVEMAAHAYFGKSAKDLTLSEAAMLAGLLKGTELLQSRSPSGALQGSSQLRHQPHEGRWLHHRPAEGSGASSAPKARRLYAGSIATAASASSIFSAVRPRPTVSTVRRRIPTPFILRSTPNCSAKPKARCRMGSPAMRSPTAGCSSGDRKPISRRP